MIKENYGTTKVVIISENKESLEGLKGVLKEFEKMEKPVSLNEIAKTITGNSLFTLSGHSIPSREIDIPADNSHWLLSVKDKLITYTFKEKLLYALFIETLDAPFPDRKLLNVIAGEKAVFYSYYNFYNELCINTDNTGVFISDRFLIRTRLNTGTNKESVSDVLVSSVSELIDCLNAYNKEDFVYTIDFSVLELMSIDDMNTFINTFINNEFKREGKTNSYIKIIPFRFTEPEDPFKTDYSYDWE